MADVEFTFRTGKLEIDYTRCKSCKSFACVKACSLFGASLFRVENGRPALMCPVEEAGRRCIEDLTCEMYCQQFGNKGLKLTLDMLSLDEYRKKIGLTNK